MELERFVRARQPGWRRLDALLSEAETAPDGKLGAARLHELLRLYRQACSDLNEARALTASPELLTPLNDLAGRGYRFVYRARGTRGLAASLGRLVEVEAPAAFQRRRQAVLLAAGAFVLGALYGAFVVALDRANAERLIPPSFFTESPKDRAARIEADSERIDTVEKALTFGVSLYTHNIQVAFLAFGLGAISLVGAVALLFYNGALLGAVAASYMLDGVGDFFLAWVGPHGALELPAIVFGAAAGLVAGRALFLPGDHARGDAMRDALPDVWRMMLTTVFVLIAAGLIEGSFSQFSSKTFPTAFKIGIAALLFPALMSYLFLPRPATSDP